MTHDSLLSIDPRETITHVYKKTCIRMFTEAFFCYRKKKLEITQMSITRRLYKHFVVQSYNGIPLSNKKQQTTYAHHNIDDS